MSTSGNEDDQESTASEQQQHHPGQNEASGIATKEEEYSSEEERDGRFYGPDSSWRHYTQYERDLASSLDHAQNNDLSLHLYNAHAWKRRHRDPVLFRKAQTWHSKNRWINPDETGKLPFLPHSSWTAWPLRPEDVPRSREQWGVAPTDPDEDSGTYSKQQPWSPSMNLRDELQAIMLRKAKERFLQRRWVNVGDVPATTKARRSSPESPVSGASAASATSAMGATPSAAHKREDVESGDDHKNLPTNVPIFSAPIESYVPVFTADDEAAGAILKPTVNHIIKKLDDLLIGLHKSRQGHRKEPGAPRGRSARSNSGSKSRSRSKSRPGTSSKRKRVASDAAPPAEEAMLDQDENISVTSDRSQSNTRHRALGLRDWSEVLGIAALTGWDQTALDRAARRCAATFGETMSMRFMPDTSLQQEKVVDYVPEAIPEFDLLSDEDEQTEHDPSEEDGEGNPIRFNCCPYVQCPRHEKPYETRWRLREHLKRNHALSLGEIDAMENGGTDRNKRNREELGIKEDSDEEDGDEDGRNDASMKAEPDEEEGDELKEVPRITRAAVRRDGFLEPITIPLPRSDLGSKRGQRSKREYNSSDD